MLKWKWKSHTSVTAKIGLLRKIRYLKYHASCKERFRLRILMVVSVAESTHHHPGHHDGHHGHPGMLVMPTSPLSVTTASMSARWSWD